MSIKHYALMAYNRTLALEEVLIEAGNLKKGDLQKKVGEIMLRGREATQKAQAEFWERIKIGLEIEFVPYPRKWDTIVRGIVISKSEEPYKAITFKVSFSQAARSHKKGKIYCENIWSPDQIKLHTGFNVWEPPPTAKPLEDEI